MRLTRRTFLQAGLVFIGSKTLPNYLFEPTTTKEPKTVSQLREAINKHLQMLTMAEQDKFTEAEHYTAAFGWKGGYSEEREALAVKSMWRTINQYKDKKFFWRRYPMMDTDINMFKETANEFRLQARFSVV